MDTEEVVDQAADRLRGIGSHVPFETAVKDIPFDVLGASVEDVPFTIWQLVEHLRITQRDILRYTNDPSYESPAWPEGYWPDERAPRSAEDWHASTRGFMNDREELIVLLGADPTRRLEGTDHSVLRETLIASTHLSYHVGQIVLMRRLLGCWTG